MREPNKNTSDFVTMIQSFQVINENQDGFISDHTKKKTGLN
jgi:DNA helicase-2/ATP-dependent DNA helicase PcrA